MPQGHREVAGFRKKGEEEKIDVVGKSHKSLVEPKEAAGLQEAGVGWGQP